MAEAQVWETAGCGSSCVTVDKHLPSLSFCKMGPMIPTYRVVGIGWVPGAEPGRAGAQYMLTQC